MMAGGTFQKVQSVQRPRDRRTWRSSSITNRSVCKSIEPGGNARAWWECEGVNVKKMSQKLSEA